MKVKNYLLAGLAVCAFAACSNDDEPQIAGAPTSLAVEVATTETKYADEQKGDESELKTLNVTIEELQGVTGELVELNGKKYVYFNNTKGLKVGSTYTVNVVANYVESITDENQISTTKGVNTNGFYMSGSKSTGVLQNPATENNNSSNPANTVAIEVVREVSRIDIESITAAFNNSNATNVTGFEIEKIFIGNAHTATSTPSAYKHGANDAFTNMQEGTTDADRYLSAYTGTLAKGTTQNEVGQFYTLPGEDTQIVIVGKIKRNNVPDQAKTYSFVVKGDGTPSVPMAKNTIYNVNVTLNGIGESGMADLQVAVTSKNWAVKPVTVELN